MARSQSIRLAHRIFEGVGGSEKTLSPVIFMHGMLCSKEIWDIIPQRVAERTSRKVYTYDARNHGQSEHTREYSFDHNLSDLYTFMDQMKIKKSVLVGHSMGGMTAISAALRSPEIVDMAFIVEMYVKKIEKDLINESLRFMTTWAEVVANLPVDTPPTEITRISIRQLYEKLPEEMRWTSEMEGYLMSRFLYVRRPDGRYMVSYNPIAIADALCKYRDSQPIYTETRGMVSESPSLRNLLAEELKKALIDSQVCHTGKFNGPSYFIYGEYSPFFVGDEEEDIKKHFPKAEMIEMKKGSHHVFADFPAKFTDILVERLNEGQIDLRTL